MELYVASVCMNNFEIHVRAKNKSDAKKKIYEKLKKMSCYKQLDKQQTDISKW